MESNVKLWKVHNSFNQDKGAPYWGARYSYNFFCILLFLIIIFCQQFVNKSIYIQIQWLLLVNE